MSIRNFGWKCLAALAILFGVNVARGEDLSYISMNDANFASRVEALEAELASLRSNLGSESQGSNCTSGCSTGCGCGDGGVIAGAEIVMLVPHIGSLQGFGGPVITPEHSLAASPRLWLGYRNEDGLGVRARYWSFDSDANLGPIVSNLHMETLDLEFTQIEHLGRWTLDLSAGVRWGQDRNTLALPPIAGARQDFQGTGGTIALGAWRPLGGTNLSLFANTRASLLYGQDGFAAGGGIPGTPIGGFAAFKSEDDVVSVYELQIGLEWARQLQNGNRWYVRSALECQAWNLPSPALGVLDDTTGLVGATIALGFNR